ncbi:MAG TPA: AraC family transcriptional regulator [Fimbriimonadaceae bacterium]|nr:AraC family transcriptional regulator [Fimbriimonadaceae bacterium]
MIEVQPGQFKRPTEGPTWNCECPHLPFQNLPGWISRGRGNKAGPTHLEIAPATTVGGLLKKVSLLGIFALNCDSEVFGAPGACLQFLEGETPVRTVELTYGRHYVDAGESTSLRRSVGDGTGIETMGATEWHGSEARVDLLSIDVEASETITRLRFCDLGTEASFVVFDVFFHFESTPQCPFRSKGGGVSLGELGSIIRVGDRVRLGSAMDQLERGILRAQDIDEARGEALTFIAIVTAATLEMGASRAMHRVQLDAARRLLGVTTLGDVAREAKSIVGQVTASLNGAGDGPSSYLIDRSLAIVARNFAREISDVDIAAELGLSTSHFRFLFKEATGQPFHKYLVGMRLERAREMLVDHALPVTEVAEAVGFSGLSHFSRAFTQRFGVSPSQIRKVAARNSA